MPKLEPKQIQKELEGGTVWPVYWIYGGERMKARELLKRIRKTVVGEDTAMSSFNEEVLDGTEASAQSIVDAAQSLSLGGGTRLIIVRDAHAVKDQDELGALLGKPAKKEEIPSVCVFLSKDLDGRKKFSKMLTEKAAVVPCEEVSEEEREAWIGYLAKRRGLSLPPELVAQLRGLDPWNLDIIDQELEKFSIAQDSGQGDAAEAVLSGSTAEHGADVFLEAFFTRDLLRTLAQVEEIADSPEEALPLLGLLAWNVRQLALVLADKEKGTRFVKLGPFLADRFNRWSRGWSLEEVLKLQSALEELDFSVKQTPRMPLGLWGSLVSDYCR
jgi:DNA polymerase-3 subunit delta